MRLLSTLQLCLALGSIIPSFESALCRRLRRASARSLGVGRLSRLYRGHYNHPDVYHHGGGFGEHSGGFLGLDAFDRPFNHQHHGSFGEHSGGFLGQPSNFFGDGFSEHHHNNDFQEHLHHRHPVFQHGGGFGEHSGGFLGHHDNGYHGGAGSYGSGSRGFGEHSGGFVGHRLD